ncbi:DUF167 domain-containing protein [Rhizobium straminoryzae]|uniref:UPF0235 protein FNA46_23035 n=1 Tax=Rhizobium straminoryzae TaxID=1387186 RepID=A0A549SU95_9HYPH|nr:DUF167 domain-containing protein [Rhizobium straminoryzae]TRL33137.1 DUF167 domain-containing protein [Rhizobium straminoryzae]
MSPAKAFADHLRLAVRLTPNASRDGIDGLDTTVDGECWLKARVTAVPEDGKANKALIQLMAKALRLPKSSIAFISGETARKKILRIEGDPEDLMKKLDQLLAR